jgi:thymidylate synthase (FAD)
MAINNEFGFKVELIEGASSPCIPTAIWVSQHICVTDSPALDLDLLKIPAPEKAEAAIIKHELGESGKRGHYSVLRFAFASMLCSGFPHSTVMQLRTHYSSGISMLVSSLRYTGDRFSQCAEGKIKAEELFYFRPPGEYTDRHGQKYLYTKDERSKDSVISWQSCVRYNDKIKSGCPPEQARGVLCHDIIQPFVIAGDLRSWLHLLDNRSKKDAQLECQLFSDLAIEELSSQAPGIMQWYRENRYSKAILAP